MQGICKGCGQVQEVPAITQREADEKATMACNCGEGENRRKRFQLMESIEEICGPKSVDKGFNPIDPETIQRIKEAAGLVFDNKFEKATFSIDSTLVTIKRSAKKVTCSRKLIVQLTKESTT